MLDTLALLLVLAPLAASPDAWPCGAGADNQRSSCSSISGPLAISLSLHTVWRAPAQFSAALPPGLPWPSPALASGLLFAPTSESLIALNAESGRAVWSSAYAGPTSPTAAIGSLFFGSVDHAIRALSAVNGSLLWETKTGGRVYSSPAFWPARNLVLAGSADSNVWALDARSGRVVWRANCSSQIISPLALGTACRASDAAAIAACLVFAADASTKIIALNASTGVRLWSAPASASPSGVAVGRCPACDDDTVYRASLAAGVEAFLGSTGDLRWRYVKFGWFSAAPAVDSARGLLVLASITAGIVALDADSGAKRWRYALTNTLNAAAAISGDGTVYALDAEGVAYALAAADGALLWRYALPGAAAGFSTPVIGAPGRLYVSADTGISALADAKHPWPVAGHDASRRGVYLAEPDALVDAAAAAARAAAPTLPVPPSPALRWATATGCAGVASPAISANGLVFSGCDDGTFFTLDAADGSIVSSFASNETVVAAPSLLADGSVLFATRGTPPSDGTLYAFRGDRSGALLWRSTGWGEIYSPPAVDPVTSIIYLSSTQSNLVALAGNAAGAVLWRTRLPGAAVVPPALWSPLPGAPASHVFLSLVTGFMTLGINATNGDILWNRTWLSGPRDYSVYSSIVGPVVALNASGRQAAVFVAEGFILSAYTLAGDLLWVSDTGSVRRLTATPTLSSDGELLFLATAYSGLVALNTFNGGVAWSFVPSIWPDAWLFPSSVVANTADDIVWVAFVRLEPMRAGSILCALRIVDGRIAAQEATWSDDVLAINSSPAVGGGPLGLLVFATTSGIVAFSTVGNASSGGLPSSATRAPTAALATVSAAPSVFAANASSGGAAPALVSAGAAVASSDMGAVAAGAALGAMALLAGVGVGGLFLRRYLRAHAAVRRTLLSAAGLSLQRGAAAARARSLLGGGGGGALIRPSAAGIVDMFAAEALLLSRGRGREGAARVARAGAAEEERDKGMAARVGLAAASPLFRAQAAAAAALAPLLPPALLATVRERAIDAARAALRPTPASPAAMAPPAPPPRQALAAAIERATAAVDALLSQAFAEAEGAAGEAARAPRALADAGAAAAAFTAAFDCDSSAADAALGADPECVLPLGAALRALAGGDGALSAEGLAALVEASESRAAEAAAEEAASAASVGGGEDSVHDAREAPAAPASLSMRDGGFDAGEAEAVLEPVLISAGEEGSTVEPMLASATPQRAPLPLCASVQRAAPTVGGAVTSLSFGLAAAKRGADRGGAPRQAATSAVHVMLPVARQPQRLQSPLSEAEAGAAARRCIARCVVVEALWRHSTAVAGALRDRDQPSHPAPVEERPSPPAPSASTSLPAAAARRRSTLLSPPPPQQQPDAALPPRASRAYAVAPAHAAAAVFHAGRSRAALAAAAAHMSDRRAFVASAPAAPLVAALACLTELADAREAAERAAMRRALSDSAASLCTCCGRAAAAQPLRKPAQAPRRPSQMPLSPSPRALRLSLSPYKPRASFGPVAGGQSPVAWGSRPGGDSGSPPLSPASSAAGHSQRSWGVLARPSLAERALLPSSGVPQAGGAGSGGGVRHIVRSRKSWRSGETLAVPVEALHLPEESCDFIAESPIPLLRKAGGRALRASSSAIGGRP